MSEYLYKFPVKGLEHGYGYFTSVEWHQEVVCVDAKTFFNTWIEEEIAQNKCNSFEELKEKYNHNARFMGGDDNPISPHHTDPEDAISRLNEYYSEVQHPFEIPLVAYRDGKWAKKEKNTIDFLNGRHRLINHFRAGASVIPVQLTFIDGTEAFKRKYAAKDISTIDKTRWETNKFGMYPKLKV